MPAVTELLAAVAKGNYLETACKAAGIPKQTVYRWLKRAEADEEPFMAFRDALQKAEAKAELEVLETVRQAGKAGPQYWPASMTLLERRHPERWGKRQEGESGPKVLVQIGVSAPDVSIAVVNTIPSYQTQNLGEGEQHQALAAPYPGASEAKVEGER